MGVQRQIKAKSGLQSQVQVVSRDKGLLPETQPPETLCAGCESGHILRTTSAQMEGKREDQPEGMLVIDPTDTSVW